LNTINGPDPRRIGGAGQAGGGVPSPPSTRPKGAAFDQVLRDELRRDREVKLSGHAMSRLQMRNIALSPDDMSKLREAVDRAESKGAREALVLMSRPSPDQDLALVVSVRNRTVITAMEGDSLKDNVFTNIDSAVVVR
jgi:flagellar operon protein